MGQGHHLKLRSCPPLFYDLQQFNVKAVAAHLPIIQKEVDEPHAKGTVESLSSGAGFYSSVFVVPKCSGGCWPALNLNRFNYY